MSEVDSQGKDFHHPCDRERNKGSALCKATSPLGMAFLFVADPRVPRGRSRSGRVFAGSCLLGTYCVHIAWALWVLEV